MIYYICETQNQLLMRKLFFLIALAIPSLIFAQQKVGNLTIFSEDGDKFYLILNGEKQNTVPQTNIRIEELPQPYYNAKIIYGDSTIATISKNNLRIADAEGTMMDVTYKIRRDKSGKAKMNYYSMIPVQQDFIPSSGTYVHHYGRPEQTVTTTTTTTADPVSASVNVNGVSMNVTINDPLMTQSTSTTTTVSSSSSNTTTNTDTRGSKCNGWPMKATDFSAAKKSINEASFEESKLSTAKSIASSNCLSSEQVTEICKLFSFEESKLTFAKYAYKHTTDPSNYFKVNTVFSFDASREELNNYISGE